MSVGPRTAYLRGRITVKGTLRLDAPLLIGEGASGEARSDRDIHVLRNKDGVPFIPGTSLAGALRSFADAEDAFGAQLLFGTLAESGAEKKGGDDQWQSAVSLYDVLLKDAVLGSRDGVSIDEVTRTAVLHGKYDYEIVESGACGAFYAEILLRGIHEGHWPRLKAMLERLRDLLCSGFHVGALTTKGFGRLRLEAMEIDGYDFQRSADVIAWLSPKRGKASYHRTERDFAKSLTKRVYGAEDFMIEADFALAGALIVRDYEEANQMREEGKAPDALMKKNPAGAYIIPGTSLKGVLRHRAAFILRTLGKEAAMADALMGPAPQRMQGMKQEERFRSRFVVEEAEVKGEAYPQTRIRCDRFTGGTISSALFSTEPVWAADMAAHAVTLRFGAKRAQAWEAGLCLLLLKDLWLGRIAIGGEKSVGRGSLMGLCAEIYYRGKKWTLKGDQPTPEATARALQEWVTALCEEAGA